VADLVVIVPSRGRPEAARALVQAFKATATADTMLVFAVDDDDPTRDEYPTAVREDMWVHASVCYVSNDLGSMVCTLNKAAYSIVNTFEPAPFAVGFMGDDHRPRTVGWDAAYLDALRKLGTGIVYCDDGWQGEKLPTQCAITADIVATLGFMAPPGLRHMYVDNFWLDLGAAAGCIRYLPDVIVEHMHPAAGKAVVDAGYERVNAPQVFAADREAYERYRADRFDADVVKVQALMSGVIPQPGPQLGAFARQPTGRGGYPATRLPAAPDGPHEWRLFDEGTVPEHTRPEWYAGRDHAPHLEQPGHRDRLMQTATFVAQIAFSHGLRTVVDLGAGDGGLLSLLGPNLTAWGYDLTPANLDAAKERGADVRPGDVIDSDVEWGQIAVCTEMLEHLVDPHAFLRRVASHAQALVCSSPKDERPGSAYEYHTWCWDLEGYRALVEQGGFRVLRQRTVHGFQVVLAVRP